MEVKGTQPISTETISIKTKTTTVVEETIIVTRSEFEKFAQGGTVPDAIKNAINSSSLTRRQRSNSENLLRMIAKKQAESDTPSATVEKTKSFVCKTCNSKFLYTGKRSDASRKHRQICHQ